MATETTQQIVREAEEIEAYKLNLLENARALAFNHSDTGVGSYTPYMDAANQALGSAYSTTGEAADILRGADTRGQFTDAQNAMAQAGGASANITSGIGQVNQGIGLLDAAAQRTAASDTTGQFGAARQDLNAGLGSLATAQNMAAMSSQANLQPATAAIGQGIGGLTQAQQLALGAGAADYGGSQNLISQGLGQGQQAVGMAQQAAQQPGFLAQNVSLGQASQAARQAGPSDFSATYGNLQNASGLAGDASSMASQAAGQPGFAQAQQAITQGLGALGGGTQSYDPSSAQAFMDPYRQQVIDETMRQMDRQSAIAGQGAAAQAVRSGAFGGEREGVQRAEMQRNLMDQKSSTIANLLSQGYSQSQASQQAQLGQAAAGLYGNLAQNQVAAGQGLGQLGVQQAQLGQGAAGQYLQAAQQYGNLASQGGALAGQEASINQNISNLMMQQAQARNQAAQTAAGIYGQQAQQFQGLGQGIGALAGQQFNIGQQQAQGLGQLAGQLGQLGVQQGALGQTAQALQQGDINFLYNTGQAQQAFDQQALDAQRATQLQQVYAPYQQAGFLSDIYKGAPSTQMSTQVASQPTASPFQQAVGIGLGAISTAAGVKKAGLF
jgi:hypothetical protein